MGQYYRPVMEKDGKVTVFNREVDGKYTSAKLMEHSWWGNDLMSAIAEMMYQTKVRLIWCGDYAEDDEIEKCGLTVSQVWDCKGKGVKSTDFSIDNLFLCNHDTKEFIDLKKYKEKSENDGWIINPISLLTAQGNGRGGGDYYYGNCVNQELVGSWSWDLISLETTAPEGYTEDAETYFKE